MSKIQSNDCSEKQSAANQLHTSLADINITGINHEGYGIGRLDGQVVCVAGALPNERVSARIIALKKRYMLAELQHIKQSSPIRQTPLCLVFHQCGGCTFQHVDSHAQVALKQRIWEEQLQRLGSGLPQQILPPIYGIPWHYRQRARFHIAMDNQLVKIGFVAKQSQQVVSAQYCKIIPSEIASAIVQWEAFLSQHTAHFEINALAFYESETDCIWVVSMSDSCSTQAKAMLADWERQLNVLSKKSWHIWYQIDKQPAQPVKRESIQYLSYHLPEYQTQIAYTPDNFTQINHAMNNVMVGKAMTWLQPKLGERIIDWFCGLGNFSIPIARSGATVLGIEGSRYMVDKATNNARLNQVDDVCTFQVANLFRITAHQLSGYGLADKWLLDPPRAGAKELIHALAQITPAHRPNRIVYISCYAATLARDAKSLVGLGYRMLAGGVMNLFPQTEHIESLLVFERVVSESTHS